MTALLSPARAIAEQLPARALDVCRTYLANGRRCGGYWCVGDAANRPGRPLYVRLTGPARGRGAAGHWTDAAIGEHGDLLDLIRTRLGLATLQEALIEARTFLNVPPAVAAREPLREPPSRRSDLAAQLLFARDRPVPGMLAEACLRARGIAAPLAVEALWFHPSVVCRERGPHVTAPALLAAVTDLSGRITAVQRTWLDPLTHGKARLKAPRRSLGNQLGHGVRLGPATGAFLVGEGLETVLSLVSALPSLPMVAGLSAHHLAVLELPAGLRRLYIARNRDRDGARAAGRLRERADAQAIAVTDLVPFADDFNTDLERFGLALSGPGGGVGGIR